MSELADDIRREDGATKGRYVYRPDPSLPAAEMTFTKVGTGQLIIDHTEVPEAYKGQGVGVALVLRAVEEARRDGIRITPLCPFAAAQFRRHPEWHDVLAR